MKKLIMNTFDISKRKALLKELSLPYDMDMLMNSKICMATLIGEVDDATAPISFQDMSYISNTLGYLYNNYDIVILNTLNPVITAILGNIFLITGFERIYDSKCTPSLYDIFVISKNKLEKNYNLIKGRERRYLALDEPVLLIHNMEINNKDVDSILKSYAKYIGVKYDGSFMVQYTIDNRNTDKSFVLWYISTMAEKINIPI